MQCINVICDNKFDSIEKRLFELENKQLDIDIQNENNFFILSNAYDNKFSARSAALVTYKNNIKRGSLIAYILNTVPEGFENYENTMQLEQICFDPLDAFNEGIINIDFLSDRDSNNAIQWNCLWCNIDRLAIEIDNINKEIQNIYKLLEEVNETLTLTVSSYDVWYNEQTTINFNPVVTVKTNKNNKINVGSECKFYDLLNIELSSLGVVDKFKTQKQYSMYAKLDDLKSNNATVYVTPYFKSYYIITNDSNFDKTKKYVENLISEKPSEISGNDIDILANGYLYIKTKYDFKYLKIKNNISIVNFEDMTCIQLSDGYKVYKWPNKLGSNKIETIEIR